MLRKKDTVQRDVISGGADILYRIVQERLNENRIFGWTALLKPLVPGRF